MRKYILTFLVLASNLSFGQSDYFFLGTWSEKAELRIDNEKGVTLEAKRSSVTFNPDNTGFFIEEGQSIRRPFLWKYYEWSPQEINMVMENGRTAKWSLKKLDDSNLIGVSTIDRRHLDMCSYYYVFTLTKK